MLFNVKVVVKFKLFRALPKSMSITAHPTNLNPPLQTIVLPHDHDYNIIQTNIIIDLRVPDLKTPPPLPQRPSNLQDLVRTSTGHLHLPPPLDPRASDSTLEAPRVALPPHPKTRRSVIGKWQLGRVVGEGSSGKVCVATHSVTAEIVLFILT